MPPLHETRLPTGRKPRPFTEVGVDLYGPYRVTLGLGPETRQKTKNAHKFNPKRWVLVVSCCWTRAVNLLVVQSEDTKSTDLAMDRHTADYGIPLRVNCDNGGNFEGMRNDQKKQWAYLVQLFKKKHIEWPQTKWTVNPAYTPRFGSNFESMVKIGRHTMTKLLDHYSLLNDEEFLTVVTRTKSHMNNRPLNAVSPDPDDPLPLCPNDFLTTGNKYREMVPILVGEPTLTEESRAMRSTMEKLWTIYEREYVSELRRTKIKIQHTPDQLKVGQVVHLISEKYQPLKADDRTMPGVLHSLCGYYRVGRIIDTHEGVDCQGDPVQRVFTVRMGDRRYPGSLKDERLSYTNIYPILF